MLLLTGERGVLMNPIIKWPGGKSGEISKFESLIPSFDRYVEPFFGGGALFFHLRPKKSTINDISKSLIQFYKLVKKQDKQLFDLLMCYNNSFTNLQLVCDENYTNILNLYDLAKTHNFSKNDLKGKVAALTNGMSTKINSGFHSHLLLSETTFTDFLNKMVTDKIIRTIKNDAKSSFNEQDMKANLITGFTSGYYMYFRKLYNDMHLGKIIVPSSAYEAANFYFIREYCYGSMFRYNSEGEFNIPYGGISYNAKNFKTKIDNIFNRDVSSVFSNTEIKCLDFQDFFKNTNLTSADFMFLDPPYDTNFSDYEGKDFTLNDQERLASSLYETPAKFILVIKNTPFIKNLYNQKFNILSFDNHYTYNVRSRNERKTEHLIITNIPVNN